MLFSSLIFICYFLPIFLACYYALGARNAVLFTGSTLFYCWGDVDYLPILLGMVLLNYSAAHLMERVGQSARKLIFITVLILDVLNLCFYKYADFFIEQLNAALSLKLVGPGVALPLGISFFTFQLVSYMVDIYTRRVRVEDSFISFSTYIMMYPHLIAGPIVRFAEIADELKSRTIRLDMVGLGVQYFIVGLCQKVLIANTVAPLADGVFAAGPEGISTISAWLGVLAYTLQIYFDFCGYSNMAIGLAFMLGFHFPRNFNFPYSSRSVTEFWRRWHISLSSWFRDYVYIPLGGSRGGRLLTLRNLLIVFFLTGLWHGAAWTFIVWGMFHGMCLVIERIGFNKLLDRLPALVGHLYTVLVVMIGWIFFRADDFSQATTIIQAMFGFARGEPVMPLSTSLTPEVVVALILGCILSFPVLAKVLDAAGLPKVGALASYHGPNADTLDVHLIPVWVLLGGFMLSVALLATNTLNPFLYFRF